MTSLAKLKKRLGAHRPHRLKMNGLRDAGVLVPLLLGEQGYELIFIRRSRKLKKHAGQIAFPGGAREKQDADLLETALREAEEEVGLNRSGVQVLGELDQVWTPTGYRMCPHVVLLEHAPTEPDGYEVEEILRLPLTDFLVPERFRSQRFEREGKSLRVVFFELEHCTVWGATGRITERLLEVGFGWDAPDGTEWEGGPR